MAEEESPEEAFPLEDSTEESDVIPEEAESEGLPDCSTAEEELSEIAPDTDELIMLSELSEDEVSPQATAANVNAQEQESKNAINDFFIITP